MAILTKKKNLKILFVATEMEPFASAGGLGSVMQSLPRALNEIGHDARVMIPRYLSITDEKHKLKSDYNGLNVPTDNKQGGPKVLQCNVKKYEGGTEEGRPTTVYFLENQEYYEQRANVYGYADDPVRWALLCRGTLEFLLVSDWFPDVIVCADWQTGYLPNYLETVYKENQLFDNLATVFSIHNLSYQGIFKHRFVSEMDFDDGHSPIPGFNEQRLLNINGMRRGIMYADVINTVSPTYSQEIMTEEYGEGLNELLAERRTVLFGILNGIDYQVWNPYTDTNINTNFDANSLDKRVENKRYLQERFGLAQDPEKFVIGMATRLTNQKGVDLLEPIIKKLLEEIPMQLIVVGTGDTSLMKLLQDLQAQFPKQVAVELRFDPMLPHILFAGADATLVPSRFEPSGLIQMQAMHYGTAAIVRKTGGLADTVEDYSPATGKGDGFVFEKIDSLSLLIAIVRAYENFLSKDTWGKIQKRAMKKDFTWESSARQYEKLFQKAISLTTAKQ